MNIRYPIFMIDPAKPEQKYKFKRLIISLLRYKFSFFIENYFFDYQVVINFLMKIILKMEPKVD